MKRFLASTAAALLAVMASAAFAQDAHDYPSRPVRLIVPNAPGSSIDIMSRIVAAKLGEVLGGSTVVENRDGAAGVIGMEAGKNSKPDGYVLMCASNGSMLIAPMLHKSPPYDALSDFSFISTFAVLPNVLVVNPDLPVHSVKELVDYARSHPGQLNMASAGVGSASHLAGVLLMSMAGFDSLHVPHKGGGPSVNSVIAGQTHWTITPAPAVMPFVKSGRLRALGESLPKRSALLGDIPPVADTVAGYDNSGWAGLVGPRGMPKPVVDKLNAAVAKTLVLPEVKEALAAQGAEGFPGSPEEFRSFMAKEQANIARIIKAAQLKLE